MWLAWIAFAVGIAAVTLELAADTQMRRFVAAGRPGAGDGPGALVLVTASQLFR